MELGVMWDLRDSTGQSCWLRGTGRERDRDAAARLPYKRREEQGTDLHFVKLVNLRRMMRSCSSPRPSAGSPPHSQRETLNSRRVHPAPGRRLLPSRDDQRPKSQRGCSWRGQRGLHRGAGAGQCCPAAGGRSPLLGTHSACKLRAAWSRTQQQQRPGCIQLFVGTCGG